MKKPPRHVSGGYWPRMEAYLNSVIHTLPPSGRKLQTLLVEAFPDYKGDKTRLRETEEVKSYVKAILAADILRERRTPVEQPAPQQQPLKASFSKIANTETELIETETGATFRGTYPVDQYTTVEEYIALNVDLEKYSVKKTGKKTFQGFMKDEVTMQPRVVTMVSLFVDLVPKEETGFNYQLVRDGVIEEMKQAAPKYHSFKRLPLTEGHLQILDPADTHFGKLAHFYSTGDTYTLKDAARKVTEGFEGLLNKSQGFQTDRFLLILGNDMLHVDNAGRTTTKGTKQDTDGMWYEAFMTAKKTFVDVIGGLATLADVDVVFNPSNHDYTSGWMLFDSIASWFHNSKNINFDGDMKHRKYYRYHESLIGTTHGNGVKPASLMNYMPVEAKELWSQTTHRNWYYHHVHHYNKAYQAIGKDYVGGTVQSVRSLSGTDVYHDEQGYTGVPKAIESFIHSKKHGQIAQFTHIVS